MKKILFAAYSLDYGGVETALITLLNYLSKEDYDITLCLERKQGVFLDRHKNNYIPTCNWEKSCHKKN